ncbi:MFS transporter [Bifidobacterium bombi]|uniref:MFS transporter n=1 Tax=Bifidobacterium bombi TaxID=471511 RepID=UPI0009DE8E09|nr:MFS transporter [Bifidobacterium bombi]
MTFIGTYHNLFWTRFCGMSIATAQTFIGLSTLVSAIVALCFVVLDDNLYRFCIGRRFGRRRLVLLVVAPLVLLGALMWIPGIPVPLYFLTYVFWIVLAQLFAAAYNPLAGEMTRNFNERNLLSTTRLTISSLAGTVILLASGVVLKVFGDRRPQGYMILAVTTVMFFSAAVFICWRSTWEMTHEEAGFARYSSDDGDGMKGIQASSAAGGRGSQSGGYGRFASLPLMVRGVSKAIGE